MGQRWKTSQDEDPREAWARMNMDWAKILDELKHQLGEWCVFDDTFREKTIQQQVLPLALNCGTQKVHLPELQNFPEDDSAAVEFVLRNQIENGLDPSFCVLCHDQLGLGFHEPCYRHEVHEKRHRAASRKLSRIQTKASNKDVVIEYKRKDAFEKLRKQDLDPSFRFVYEHVSEAEVMYDRWFREDESHRAGVVFEARLACFAVRNVSCYNCKCKNSLRWCGGPATSWQDMVCIECKSMYEVKTKESMQKVESSFQHNNILGGSFYAYCQMKKGLQPTQKMFLVVLPRKSTPVSGVECHPVYIEEIENVLPALSRWSFDSGRRNISLASRVSVKPSSQPKPLMGRFWFRLPVSEPVSFYNGMMVDLFKERYTEAELVRLEGKYGHSHVTGGAPKDKEKGIGDQIGAGVRAWELENGQAGTNMKKNESSPDDLLADLDGMCDDWDDDSSSD